jgi:hypothetical protein
MKKEILPSRSVDRRSFMKAVFWQEAQRLWSPVY